MSTVEDFENAPAGATATNFDGIRAMKMSDGGWVLVAPACFYYDDDEMVQRGFTLDRHAPASAREALDLAWELAHEVEEGQVIPEGTRFLEFHVSGIKEHTAYGDREISPGLAPITRTLEPLPEPDWQDAPAVIATPGWGPDRGVWVPKSGGHWKCACCRDERHWSELRDVTPLYPKGQEA